LFAICYLEAKNTIYKVSFYSKTETMIFNIIKVHKQISNSVILNTNWQIILGLKFNNYSNKNSELGSKK